MLCTAEGDDFTNTKESDRSIAFGRIRRRTEYDLCWLRGSRQEGLGVESHDIIELPPARRQRSRNIRSNGR
jgi:hypothetical protein